MMDSTLALGRSSAASIGYAMPASAGRKSCYDGGQGAAPSPAQGADSEPYASRHRHDHREVQLDVGQQRRGARRLGHLRNQMTQPSAQATERGAGQGAEDRRKHQRGLGSGGKAPANRQRTADRRPEQAHGHDWVPEIRLSPKFHHLANFFGR